jgi:integrase
MFVLYTGLRRNEAITLRWEAVDLEAGTLTVADTKNGKPLTLPLTRQVREIFARRWEAAKPEQEGQKMTTWVFPSPESRTGHYADPKSAVTKVEALSGVAFYTHALRNTFISIARRELGIDESIVKRLVNHARSRDVTEMYAAPWTIEQLRAPAQQIADRIEALMRPPSNVHLAESLRSPNDFDVYSAARAAV